MTVMIDQHGPILQIAVFALRAGDDGDDVDLTCHASTL